ATTSFTLTVTVVAPTARTVTAPATIPEGTPEPFTGSATSLAAVDNSTLNLSWQVTKNGSPYASGSGASFTFTPDDEGTFVVTFTASDDGGLPGTDSQTMTGTNVAPKAAITGITQSAPLVIAASESLSYAGNFSDAGALDSHIVTWNFGDGSTTSANYGHGGSAGLSATHPHAAAGTDTGTLAVADAATLRGAVHAVKGSIGTYNRFLEWWPLGF